MLFVVVMVLSSSINLTTCTKGFVELNEFMLLKTILLYKERHPETASTAHHCFHDGDGVESH